MDRGVNLFEGWSMLNKAIRIQHLKSKWQLYSKTRSTLDDPKERAKCLLMIHLLDMKYGKYRAILFPKDVLK